jgi:hypothetical protein
MLNWVAEGSWGLGQNYYVGTGTSSLDFGSTTWSGTYFDCAGLGYSNCNLPSTYTTMLIDQTNYPPANPLQQTGPKIGPENIADINFNWGTTGRPLNGASDDPAFADTFVARWTRNVTLSPGTYSFSAIFDDAVRLWIDDATGTNLTGSPATASGGGANSQYMLNDWVAYGAPTLRYTSFTVTGNISRVLTLEYFENTGNAQIILNATRSSYSFTDSPDPAFPTIVNSLYPGNSSLMLGGFFSLPAVGTPSLEYQRLYDLPANNFFYVEVSTDGGFTWTQIASETKTGAQRLPPSQYWEAQNVSLSLYSGQSNIMIRFRLDTRGAAASGGVTGDGVYIAEIRIDN